MLERLLAVNAGVGDRVIRVLAGVALLALAFVGPRTPWGYLGLVPLVTGLAGRCPAYALLGIRTCPMPPGRTSQTQS